MFIPDMDSGSDHIYEPLHFPPSATNASKRENFSDDDSDSFDSNSESEQHQVNFMSINKSI